LNNLSDSNIIPEKKKKKHTKSVLYLLAIHSQIFNYVEIMMSDILRIWRKLNLNKVQVYCIERRSFTKLKKSINSEIKTDKKLPFFQQDFLGKLTWTINNFILNAKYLQSKCSLYSSALLKSLNNPSLLIDHEFVHLCELITFFSA